MEAQANKDQIPRLIALHAADHGGKDTAASILKRIAPEPPESWVPFASHGFADKVKESIAASFGIPPEEAIEWVDLIKQNTGWVMVRWDDENGGKHERRIPGRKFIRDFATKGHRELFDPNFWVDLLLPHERWHENFDCAVVCVITDLRFNSEAQRVRELGGEIWALVGRGDSFDEDHLSNGDFKWKEAERIIDNSGDFVALEEGLRSCLFAV